MYEYRLLVFYSLRYIFLEMKFNIKRLSLITYRYQVIRNNLKEYLHCIMDRKKTVRSLLV